MITFKTADGGTVQITRQTTTTDLHYRTASGRTVATVVRSHAEAAPLIKALSNVAG